MSVSILASEFADLKNVARSLHTEAGIEGLGMFLFKFRDTLQRHAQNLQKNFEAIITAASTPEMEKAKPGILKVKELLNDFLAFSKELDQRANDPKSQGRTKEDLVDEYITLGMSHKDPEIGKLVNLVKGKDTVNNLMEALDAVLEYKEGNQGSLMHALQMAAAFNKQHFQTKQTPTWGKAASLVAALDAVAGKVQDVDTGLAEQIDTVANTVESCMAKETQNNKTASAAGTTSIQEKTMTQKNFAMLKQASEMQAQAYDLLEKAAKIITACNCADGSSLAIGDAVPAGIVAPVATPVSPVETEEPVLVIKLADKTASLAILDKVATELEANDSEDIRKMAAEVKAIATQLDKQAKVIEDGMGKDKLVDEMVDSFQGKVYENGKPQGEASSRAVDSFNTDKSFEVQNLIKKGYPKA